MTINKKLSLSLATAVLVATAAQAGSVKVGNQIGVASEILKNTGKDGLSVKLDNNISYQPKLNAKIDSGTVAYNFPSGVFFYSK